MLMLTYASQTSTPVLFFWGDTGVHIPLKHFVNLTGESKNFKMLELRVPLNIFLEKKLCLTLTKRDRKKLNIFKEKSV
jgi:hypothetical protein